MFSARETIPTTLANANATIDATRGANTNASWTGVRCIGCAVAAAPGGAAMMVVIAIRATKATKLPTATSTLTISARCAPLSKGVSWKARAALVRASIPPSRVFESRAIVRAMAYNQRA
jgi:hypothetical protein